MEFPRLRILVFSCLALILLVLNSGLAIAGGEADWNRAVALSRAGKSAQAIDYYSRAINSGEYSGKDLAKLYFNRGFDHGRLSQNDQALSDYQFVIRLDPTNAKALSSVCYQHLRRNDLDKALKICNQTLRVKPDHAPAYAFRAQIYTRKGNFDEAERDYEHAVRLSPKNWVIHFSRGKFHEYIGNTAAAKNDFIQAFRNAPPWVQRDPPTTAAARRHGIDPVNP